MYAVSWKESGTRAQAASPTGTTSDVTKKFLFLSGEKAFLY